MAHSPAPSFLYLLSLWAGWPLDLAVAFRSWKVFLVDGQSEVYEKTNRLQQRPNLGAEGPSKKQAGTDNNSCAPSPAGCWWTVCPWWRWRT